MDYVIIKLSAKDIHVLMQAIRIASEDSSLAEYCNRAYLEQLKERLSRAK